MSATPRLSKNQRNVLNTLLRRSPKSISMAAIALHLDMHPNGVSQVFGIIAAKGLAVKVGTATGGDAQIQATDLAFKLYPLTQPEVQHPQEHLSFAV